MRNSFLVHFVLRWSIINSNFCYHILLMRYWGIIFETSVCSNSIWSIVEQKGLENEFLMVVLVKYIILKKIKISV